MSVLYKSIENNQAQLILSQKPSSLYLNEALQTKEATDSE
jgi:hypothetical protein